MENFGILLEQQELFGQALDLWGNLAQIIMVQEETNELGVELCHYLRGEENYEKIAEEMVDLRIMLDQLELLLIRKTEPHEFQDHLGRIKVQKLTRLKKRIEKAEAKQKGIEENGSV